MQNSLDNLRNHIHDLPTEEVKQILSDMPPHDVVEIWDDLSRDEALQIFLLFSLEKKVDLITELGQSDQEALIERLSEESARQIFDLVEPDDLVDIIQSLSEEVRGNVWRTLSEDARSQMQFLLRFDQDDAAGLMTPRYLAIRRNVTVGQAFSFIRTNATDVETIYYIYVVDDLKRLQGVVSLRDLLFNDDHARLEEIMVTKVVSVQEDTDQEEVAKLLESYDLIALPVVDGYNRLLGIVTFDDAIDVIREEQTEDVYKMGAMDGAADRYSDSSILRLVRKRIPWLTILLLAGTLTTNVISHFESLILAAGFLVWFVPVITQTGGNSGTQSSTLMIRGIAMGEIQFRDVGDVLFKEFLVGLTMGILLAGVIVLRGVFLPPGVAMIEAVAIGAALVFVVVFSSLIGALAPLIIHRMGLDPTVMAGPLMATLIDVAGLTIYFQAARLILQI